MTDDRGDPCADLDFASLHEHGIAPCPPMSDGARAAFGHVLALRGERDVDVAFGRGALASDAAKDALSLAPSAPTIPHASYLGASDIGAILGLDPMRTALDVWTEKTGRVLRSAADELEAGNDHEAGVVAGARRRMLRERRAVTVAYPGPGTITNDEIGPALVMCAVCGRRKPPRGRDHRDDDACEHECPGRLLAPHPSDLWPGERRSTFGFPIGFAWRGATLDAVVHLDETRRAALEAKYVGAGQAHAWGPEPGGIDAIPLRTVVQVHWQTLHARERWPEGVWDRAFVAADIGTDRRLYEIQIDDAMIADLLEAGREWWRAHVVAGAMPEPTSRDLATLSEIFPHVERDGLSPFPPDELRALAEDYVVAREITLRHRDELARIGAKIRALLGTAEGYRWQGGRVTWREDASGARRLHVKTWRTDR